MLEYIIDKTNEYLDGMPKVKRKKIGQFFTSKETAKYMAELFNIPQNKSEISILDAGAGSGILCCALIERLERMGYVNTVKLTCYENDINVLPVLRSNLDWIKKQVRYSLEYEVVVDNYITSQYLEFNHLLGGELSPKKYDMVIGNPPFMKLPKDAPEAKAMPDVCYGAPNMYFLFASMALFNLSEDAEMVYIMPRSWTSGAYFKFFRKYFLSEGKLEHIHLFGSRKKVFDKEDVLQETIIIKLKKTQLKQDFVKITSSESNGDFDNINSLDVPYEFVVSGKEKYVYLVTNNDELNVLKTLNNWNNTLPEIGLKMKTGLTVDFRNRDILRDEEEEGAIPLFYSQHIRNGKVEFPIKKEHEYVITNQAGLMQHNKNYLFVKRFTAKEEPRRLQCGIYLAKDYPQYTYISTQNKINFIDGLVDELSECIVYGLYVIFNSSIYDLYYRILNGSTQVNSTEINSMPVPELEQIKEMGKHLMRTRDLSERNCDNILEGFYG